MEGTFFYGYHDHEADIVFEELQKEEPVTDTEEITEDTEEVTETAETEETGNEAEESKGFFKKKKDKKGDMNEKR